MDPERRLGFCRGGEGEKAEKERWNEGVYMGIYIEEERDVGEGRNVAVLGVLAWVWEEIGQGRE